ncbi:MAG: hypothetical protein KDB07_03220 [Planctomycetes bacterium]|nr:hypothetical protein [Planctomycetota bacterium]
MKTLDVTNQDDAKAKVSDVQFAGANSWHLVSKAWSKREGWMKSTKVMGVPGGVVLQVSTQQNDSVAEALVFVPGATVEGILGEEK